MGYLFPSLRPMGAVVAAALVVASLGCGGPRRGDINGKVTFRGQPVVWGSVVVIGPDRMPYYGTIQLDGTYTVRQVPVGPVRLGVNSPDPSFKRELPADQKKELEEQRQRAGLPERVPPPKGAWFRIPDHYADPQKSGLTGEVTAPSVTIDLTLE